MNHSICLYRLGVKGFLLPVYFHNINKDKELDE